MKQTEKKNQNQTNDGVRLSAVERWFYSLYDNHLTQLPFVVLTDGISFISIQHTYSKKKKLKAL